MLPLLYFKQIFGKNIENKTVIDIGNRDTDTAQKFISAGAIYTGVDKSPLVGEFNHENFTFIEEDFITFAEKNEKIYDMVVCINTSPFIGKQGVLNNIIKQGNHIYMNVWGHNHAWKESRYTFKHEEVTEWLKSLESEWNIVLFTEQYKVASTFSGAKEFWHEYIIGLERKTDAIIGKSLSEKEPSIF